MSAGLTFQGVSKVEHVIPGVETHVTSADKYTVKTGADTECGCTFEVHFTKEFCDSLETNDKVIITYSAMLNRNAVVAGAGNKNSAYLEFGEGNESNTDDVTTYTFGIDVVKTDDKNNKLNGATFKIYDAAVDGNEIAVVLTDDESGYRRARPDETGVAIVVKNGQIRVSGFDNGTYYLEEIDPPEGYNKLTTRQKFIIADANLDAVYNDGIFSTGSGVHVVNKTGSMLPETGGLGTLLFTLLGGSTVLGTGVVLVTKKRMSKIEDEE
jgi:fimbrial isopeptide formation D2 family protein/LPXTG-motif cell wall-anchored protein